MHILVVGGYDEMEDTGGWRLVHCVVMRRVKEGFWGERGGEGLALWKVVSA